MPCTKLAAVRMPSFRAIRSVCVVDVLRVRFQRHDATLVIVERACLGLHAPFDPVELAPVLDQRRPDIRDVRRKLGERNAMLRQGQIDVVQPHFEVIETAFEAIEATFEAIETTFEAIEATFEAIETAFEAVETTFEVVEAPFRAVGAVFEAVEAFADDAEAGIGRVAEEVEVAPQRFDGGEDVAVGGFVHCARFFTRPAGCG